MNLKIVVVILLVVTLLSGISNVVLSAMFIKAQRELQVHNSRVQEAAITQQIFLPRLLNALGAYSQKDQQIFTVLQKYGIFPNNNPQQPR